MTSSIRTMAVAASLACACACGGQSCMQPIPGGFPATIGRQTNSTQVRLTGGDEGGLKFLADHAQDLLDVILPGGTIQLPSQCSGNFQLCCGNPTPSCRLQSSIAGATFEPAPDARLRLEAEVVLKTLDSIPISGLGVTCGLSIDTTLGEEHQALALTADVAFAVDEETDLTRVSLDGMGITHLEAEMLSVTGGGLCAVAEVIIPFVIEYLPGILTSRLQEVAEKALCSSCQTVGECSQLADSCVSGKCQRGDTCLQELGLQGRAQLGAVFSSFSPRTSGALDLLELLGGYAQTTEVPGLSLSTVGGALAAPHNDCVPLLSPPEPPGVGKWSASVRSTEPRGDKPFHVGVGVHVSHLNTLGFVAFDAGALCLDIGTATVPQLSAGTLALLMPSLNDLLQGRNAPAVLQVRPTQPPTITLGAGTFDDKGAMTAPLLQLALPGLSVDIYAFVDERYLRVMTLSADVAVGLGLDVDEEGRLVPVVGDTSQALQNVSVTNSELLGEDPAKLAAAFPALLSLAIGEITKSIGPIAIPELAGISLKMVAIEPTDDQTFLSVFANLSVAPPPQAHAVTHAHIARVSLPPTEAFSVADGLDAGRAPEVEVELGGEGEKLAWSIALDGGPWSPFLVSARRLVRDPRLWLQGRHYLLVRAREVGRSETLDPAPVRLEFLVDTVAPTGIVEVARGRAAFRARDLVSQPEALAYSYRLAGGGWSDWSKDSRVAFAGELEGVRVRDEAGNVGELPLERGATGCSLGGRAGGSGWLVLCCGFGLLLLLGRRRLRPLLLLCCSLGGWGCSGDAGLTPADYLDPIDQIGRYSDLALREGKAFISAYDDVYGDLAFAEVALADLTAAIQWQWVDGVPLDEPSANPIAYRRGITEPGDDVGLYTSLALTSRGEVRIAYYDATHQALKFAWAKGRKFHSAMVEQPAAGRVGLYASLGLDAQDLPSIAYLATDLPNPDGQGGRVSSLRLATALVPEPQGEADWVIVDVDTAPISCAGWGRSTLCDAGQACLNADEQDATKSRCVLLSNDCSPACGTGTACVEHSCQAVLSPPDPPELPEGVGLFAQLRRLSSGARVIGYHDATRGEMRLATESGSGQFSTLVVDGGGQAGRKGEFAAVAVAPGDRVDLAYVDADARTLLFRSVEQGALGEASIVDDGQRADGRHWIGAGATVDSDGTTIHVAYQDQTNADFWLAKREGTTWSTRALRQGAAGYGFYPHLVRLGQALYLAQFIYDRGRLDEGKPFGVLEISAVAP